MGTIDQAAAEQGPKRPGAAPERARFPLALKLFGLTALLILIVVGLAVGITIQRANEIARTTVNGSIASAAGLFEDFEAQRLTALANAAAPLGNDPNFAAYIQTSLPGEAPPAGEAPQEGTAPAAAAAGAAPSEEAIPGAAPPAEAPATGDLVSITDQLEQRRQSLKSDLLILLDDQGRVVARTDQPALTTPTREDLYEASPLVRSIVDDAAMESAAGVLPLGGRLYHAAVAPVGVGQPRIRIAYLINSFAIDEGFANRIARSTNADVVFVPRAGSTVVRSSNAPSAGMQQMKSVDQIFRTGRAFPPIEVEVDRSSYVMTGEPLLAGTQTVGAAVFLRSLDRELAPFRQIENALLVGGGAALLLAFILSFFIAKRMTRPIEQLAGIAQRVTAGDYSVHPVIDRSDEVGILSRTFAQMISALRDKAELEELYEQMAAKSEGREGATRATEEPKADEGTLLVTDLRGLPVGDGDAAKVIGLLERAMQIQEAEVTRQDGIVREIIGHRLISLFRGSRGVIHAIRAARAINEELGAQTNQPPMSIGAGIASGDFVSGSVGLTKETGLAIVGNAPLLALLFGWHAPTGYAYISLESAEAAGNEVMASAAREEVRLKWLQQPLPVASLPLMSLGTGVMQAIGGTSTMATLKMDATAAGATAPPSGAPRELQPGQLFAGRYQIEQILGRGGMGVVYRATDTQLDEIVAIKTLPGDVMQKSPEDLERFKREIRLARKITHRNVLRTYDYGEAEGVYFISMEFVRGYTLSELLDEAPGRQMAPRLAMGIARQICRGLEAAHEQGIIHRDIKPQNVLIDHKGEVKLMDFGIARMAEAKEAMTQAGLIVGTPHYMSPEQVRGNQLDPRSDVYSMGVMIYEILAGARPFESSSLTGVLTAHITERPIPPIEVRPEIGREVNAIILRCLEKDPKVRYADAGELLEALDRIQLAASAAA